MKKLSFVLLVTLLLSLCSCAPAPNGEQIFDIKDPQSVELINQQTLVLSSIIPYDSFIRMEDEADIEAICDLLNNLTLTEIQPVGSYVNEIVVCLKGKTVTRNISILGTTVHCLWTDKYYRADRDITEELMTYINREVGDVIGGKELFEPDAITRITVENSQWEKIEMPDISVAVDALSEVTLTRINPYMHEGGLCVTLHYDSDALTLNFSGTTVWVNNKAYLCDTNISDLFSAVIHP